MMLRRRKINIFFCVVFLWVSIVSSDSIPILGLGCIDSNNSEGTLDVGTHAYRTSNDINNR